MFDYIGDNYKKRNLGIGDVSTVGVGITLYKDMVTRMGYREVLGNVVEYHSQEIGACTWNVVCVGDNMSMTCFQSFLKFSKIEKS